MRILLPALLASLVLALAPRPTLAAPSGFGFQLGITVDQSDLVGGIHGIIRLGHAVAFAPSIDVGTGGGVLSASLNANLHYDLMPDAEIGPYVGAGFSSYTAGPSSDTRDTPDAAGPTAIAGVWLNRHGGTSYSLETRAGFSGLARFTALLAVTF